MKHNLYVLTQQGFSVIEVILAAAVFMMMASGITTVILQGLDGNRRGKEQIVAYQYASEGIEAVRSMKNRGFEFINGNTGPGLILAGGTWGFSSTADTFGGYTRRLTYTNVYRDVSGNIVDTGGTLDPLSKEIKVITTWSHVPSRTNTISLNTVLTNWRLALGKKGILVYGDGGTTSDAIRYKLFDTDSSTWGTAALAADVDTKNTTKALRAVKVWASETRDEKVMISRHVTGTSQWIYAQVFDGTTWNSSDVTLLAGFTNASYLDVKNFGGAYLNNGNFVAIYSDNSTTPKMKVWDGNTWGAQSSLQALVAAPVYVIAKARPGTNEIMAAFFSTNKYTTTEYYSGSSWTIHATHATNAVLATKKAIDFDWSLFDKTKGALVFTTSTTDKTVDMQIWTANGTGGGAWNTTTQSTAQGSNMGVVSVIANPTAAEFISCSKNAQTTPDIICYENNLSGTFSNPVNQTIATASPTGIQQSYDVDYENVTSGIALMTYSDNTAVPKYKKYTTSTNTWDLNGTVISTTPYTLGILATAKSVQLPATDDIFMFMADANLDLYSVMWNGASNGLYTTPTAKAFMQHSTNGSASTDFWYDFAWDLY